ncbi:hypothetical protein [Pseudonocardia pini]|uniref:hypothetical protein n=1 Tax=Pseudonocardia pini TaxID=2758030 RepID=UPI0015F09199|nr:hypothetical protein [Pseudonocardia pini]
MRLVEPLGPRTTGAFGMAAAVVGAVVLLVRHCGLDCAMTAPGLDHATPASTSTPSEETS